MSNNIQFWWDKVKETGTVIDGLDELNAATGKKVKHNRLAEYASGTVAAPSVITRWINQQIIGDVLVSEGVSINAINPEKLNRIANKLSPPCPKEK